MWICDGSFPRQVPDEEPVPPGAMVVAAPPPFDPRAELLGWRGEWHVEPLPLSELRERRIAGVNAEAASRILAVAPEWRQRNLTARAVVLSAMHPAQVPDDWPEPYRSEWAAGAAVWAAIEAIRAHSNVLTAAIDAAETAADVLAVDITDGWPE